MNLRPTTEADIKKLSRVWFSLCAESRHTHSPSLYAWTQNLQLNLRHNPNFYSFHIEEGGKIIGFIDVEMFFEPSNSKLYAGGRHFYVNPAYRNTPVAGKLYRAAIKEAKKRGAQAIQLICFDETKDMWLHHGYKPVHTVMEKTL